MLEVGSTLPHYVLKFVNKKYRCPKLLKHPCHIIKLNELLDEIDGRGYYRTSNLGQECKVGHFNFKGVKLEFTNI